MRDAGVELELQPHLRLRLDGPTVDDPGLVAPLAYGICRRTIEYISGIRADDGDVRYCPIGRDGEVDVDVSLDAVTQGGFRILRRDALSQLSLHSRDGSGSCRGRRRRIRDRLACSGGGRGIRGCTGGDRRRGRGG